MYVLKNTVCLNSHCNDSLKMYDYKNRYYFQRRWKKVLNRKYIWFQNGIIGYNACVL